MTLFTSLAGDYGVTLVAATHDWARVDEGGFRRVEFALERDLTTGTVQATVRG